MKYLWTLLFLLCSLAVEAQLTPDFYVRTDGSDANNGTSEARAVATIDKARQLVAASGLCGTKPIIVLIHGGTYYQGSALGSPLTFTGGGSPCTGDSGSSATRPIIYQNAPGESPAISGGKKISGSWSTTGVICSGACTQYRIPYSGAYFENGLWYNGVRRFRPRLGATSGSTPANIGTYFRDDAATPAVLPADACSLNGGGTGCNGSTNASCTLGPDGVHCWDRVRIAAGSGISNSWANIAVPADAGNPTSDIDVMYWESWTVPRMRMVAFDATNNILIFSGQFNNPSNCNIYPCDYGPSFPAGRFMVEGVKDLLTLCGQWFLGRTGGAGNWFLYYNACPGENPNTDTVEVPVLIRTMITSGLQFVTYRGITFEHENWTAPQAGYISQQTEPLQWAEVSVQSSSDLSFEYDTFAHTTADGIEVFPCRQNGVDPAWCVSYNAANTSQRISIQHSNFLDIGSHGIQIGNKVGSPIDTDATVTSLCQVVDNLIDGYGRVTASAFGFNSGSFHDCGIINNEIHDGYHAEISMCRPTCQPGTANSRGTFDISVMFNLLYGAPQGVTGDIGCLYAATGGGVGDTYPNSFSGQSIRLFNNIVHDCADTNAMPGEVSGGGGHCIYLDNQTGMVEVRYNLVYRCADAAFKNTKGIGMAATGPNNWQSNVAAYFRLSAFQLGSPTSWFSTSDTPVVPASNKRMMDSMKLNVFYLDRSHTSNPSLYLTRGCADSAGFPFTSYVLWQANQYWRTDGNLSTYIKFEHVNHATNNPISACSGQPSQWDYATFANWQSGAAYTDTGGSGSTPVVTSVGEDTGGAVADPGFVSPGYPDDNYAFTNCAALAIAGFDCTQYNLTLTKAGRLTNKSFNPVVLKTFPTAEFDASHTNNGEY